ncbi:hypothetical protein HON17_02695 [bacterium]|jgi:predicted aminopeptidase|nr:hypothetical protein [bacterium]
MSLYDQKNKAFLWNLYACHPYKFENKTWCFLFLVSFGCKGFFALSQAQIERDYLEKEGGSIRESKVSMLDQRWVGLRTLSYPICLIKQKPK